MKIYSILGKILIITLLGLVACSGLQGTEFSNSPVGSQEGSLLKGIPPDDFSGLSNPLTNDERNLSEGESLYQANCSSCHGVGGKGDGPASSGLNPPPANFVETQNKLSDAYLFWRISEGGLVEPFNSLMPAWKGLLEDEQIWQIITYIRTMGD